MSEPSELGFELTEWGEKGWARAMALCTNGKPPSEYPTQDKHSLQDEADFIDGFNLCMRVFQTEGFKTVEAYGEEAA